MSNPERDYFAMESDAEHRAEIAKADREHPSDPYGWEANRVQSRWERQQFERGTTELLPLAVLVLAVAPLGCARWLGLWWAGALTVFLVVVCLVVACVVVGARGERG